MYKVEVKEAKKSKKGSGKPKNFKKKDFTSELSDENSSIFAKATKA